MAGGEATRDWLARGLGLFYGAAGLLHLLHPAPFLAIVPGFVPWPETIVALTGFAELAGAAGLQIASLRRAAGLGLALYALCVWPANWVHALSGVPIAGLPQSWWYHGPRLAAQPLLILAALHAGGWRLART
jgi:uncharacterized membrane protein